MEKIKINNSYDAAIKSGKWSKPGADFFNKIKNNKYLLKEAYLEVGDVKSDTTFSSSGCKYPHHVIKDGELVVSIPGIQAAYARAKQMGVCTGKLKAHLERHYKEMGIYQGSKLFSENVIEDNFNFIEDVLSINRYTESFNEYYENECNDLANRFKAAGITTAEKLFDIMSKWEYYSPKDWKLQSPMKTFITKRGNCHDLSLFSYEMLKRISSNYYTNQLFFIEVNDDDETGGMTHTLTFYTKDNHQLFWIEASWDDHKGIHGPYESVMKLEQAVTKAWEETNSTYDRIEFFTSNTYKVGMDLDAYVNSFVRYNENVETQINEYSEWIDKVANNELFRESVFEENINNKKDFDELILDKWFVKSDDGVENCCLKIKGYDKPFRGRSNLALLKFEDGEWYVMAKHDNKCYWCPGGGWDKNETKEHAAIRECHEEAKCNVKDVERLGTRLEWHDEPVKWVIDHVKDPDQRWYGYYTAIFVGVYDGPYTGKIDKEDQESGFKWEKYKDIRNKLLPEYPKAIDKYLKDVYAESVEFLSLFDEKSHGKLKYDFRYVYDVNTGHKLKIVYSLDNINIDYAGHAHNPNDADRHVLSNNPKANAEVQRNIAKKGNVDHISHGQKVLKIIDMVDNKELDSATTISFFASSSRFDVGSKSIDKDEIKRRIASSFANVVTLKVGEIDNSKSFKSTLLFKGADALNKAMDAQLSLKSGRGVKPQGIINLRKKGDLRIPVYSNPNKKEGKDFLIDWLANYIYVNRDEENADEDFANVVDLWNDGGFDDTNEFIAAKKMKISIDILNSVITRLWHSGNVKTAKLVAKAKYDLIRSGIVESADDNMLFGISVGKDITESINTLKSTVQNESSDDTTLMTLFVKAGLPAHTVEILENMNICSSRLDDTDEYVFCIESDKWINLIESFISDDIDSKILKFIELFESYKNHEILPTIIFPEEYTTECYSNILQKNINDIKVVLFAENGDSAGLESTMFTEADDNPPPEIEETNDVTSAIEKNTKDEPSENEIKDEEENILDTEIDDEPQKEESEPEEAPAAEEEVKEEPKNEEIKEEPPAIEEEPKEEEPKSLPKQVDAAEANKNGVNRKKLYIAFIEYAKSINPKNVFGSVFDKEVFHVTYPFIPQEMRYFYRLANPTLCVLKDDLTFFELSELKKINADNKEFPKKLIFAATPDLYYLFNIDDKKVYTATEGNGALTIKDDKSSFDLFIQNMVNKGDILNGPPEIPKEKEAVDDGSIE